jgi:hypothetical protein
MKKGLVFTFIIIALASFINPLIVNSQEGTPGDCKKHLTSPFISNGQPLQAFLTGNEIAEFHTTFFDGNIYRLVACSADNTPIIFSLYDIDRNLLYTNDDYNKTNIWDFKIAGSVECIIEAKLDPQVATSGMALMYIGFKSLEEL